MLRRDSGPEAVLGEEVADAEAGESLASVVPEERLAGVRIDASLRQEVFEHLRGLGPEWALPFLAPLAEQAHLERLDELKVTGAEVDDLLDPSPGIEHGGEECVVPTSIRRAAIDTIQYRLDLDVFEILHRPRVSPLERDTEDTLALLQALGMLAGEVAEEGVNRGESNVPRGRAVIPGVLQILKESDHILGADVFEVEHGHLTSLA
jgi:hypothetical protein